MVRNYHSWIILVYLVIIGLGLPLVFASNIQRDTYINDTLLVAVFASVTVLDGSYNTVFDDITKRGFVWRKRRIVSDIFSELGPYNTQRSYRMKEQHFWQLYNMIKPFSPIEKKETYQKGSCEWWYSYDSTIKYYNPLFCWWFTTRPNVKSWRRLLWCLS